MCPVFCPAFAQVLCSVQLHPCIAAAAGGEAEGMAIDGMDEDALLQQALALSMQVDQATPAPSSGEDCECLASFAHSAAHLAAE